jgi:hypothetical protein
MPRRPPPDDDRLRESLVERRILGAMAEGAFDDLPGAGKPIPDLDGAYDPAWWAKKWVRRERLIGLVRELRDEERRTRRRVGLGSEGAEERLAEIRAEIDRLNELLPCGDRL